MFRKAAIAALALLFFAPAAALLGVGVLINPAAAYCATPAGTVNLGPIPDSLTVTTANGETFTLNRQQLTHAATIVAVGNGITDVGRPGIKIALMAALTAATLRMLTNTGASPESANSPNDGNGGDHDSLGLFQMRPQSGWGHCRRVDGPHLSGAGVLRWADRAELPLAAWPARHPRLATDGPRRSRPSRRGLCLPRPLPQLRARRRQHPRRPHQRRQRSG